MNRRILPIVCTFQQVDVIAPGTGETERRYAWVPLKRYDNLARSQFDEGEEHPLVPLEPRSRASHNAFFAELNQSFDSLPENLNEIAKQLGIKTLPPGGFIDSEHFRKWALCETGHCEISEFDFETPEEAMRLARFYRKRDVYAQILIRKTHVTIKEAFSQSAAAMSKEPFEKSKHDVLDLLSSFTGVSRQMMRRQARESGT